jgi:mono/diheme cytochrome c family protein
VFFFTSHEGWARSLWSALDKPAATASAPAAATAKPAVPQSDPPAPPGSQPRAWSLQFGEFARSCFYCHGERPSVKEDSDRGRIIASGAAAASAAELRRAMTTPRAGGSMDAVLADPALSDVRLDAIRAWLRALRDGHAERQADRIAIRNLRSPRDPPARLALVRAEGWRLPTDAGCRVATELPGGKQCEIQLPQGSRGTLVFRLAASKDLVPQEVRLTVDGR